MFKANCGSPQLDSHITQMAVPRNSFPHSDQKTAAVIAVWLHSKSRTAKCRSCLAMLQVESIVCLLVQKHSGFAKLKTWPARAFPTNPAWNITTLSGSLLELYYLCFHNGYLNVAINKTKMFAVYYQTFYWLIFLWTKALGSRKREGLSNLWADNTQCIVESRVAFREFCTLAHKHSLLTNLSVLNPEFSLWFPSLSSLEWSHQGGVLRVKISIWCTALSSSSFKHFGLLVCS